MEMEGSPTGEWKWILNEVVGYTDGVPFAAWRAPRTVSSTLTTRPWTGTATRSNLSTTTTNTSRDGLRYARIVMKRFR